jgi:hypothetical protein
MATVTLSYRIAVGLQNAQDLVARIAAIVLNTGELELLSMIIVDDQTAVVGCDVERVVVLETTPQGDQLFPTSRDIRDATRQLWRARLNLLVPGIVQAAEPVVVGPVTSDPSSC